MSRLHIVALAILAGFLICSSSRASVIFDDFNTDEGHFNVAPTFSSTSNVSTASTADRITSDSYEGAGSEQIVAVLSTTNPARIRFLSGSGTPANNVTFHVSSTSTDGFIGFYAKTTSAAATFAIDLDKPADGGGNETGSVPKSIAADGQWHLVEWNLDSLTDWTSAAGIGGSNANLQDSDHTIDSIRIGNITAGSTYGIDFVAKSDSGSIAALVPEPASVGLLMLAVPMVMRRKTSRA